MRIRDRYLTDATFAALVDACRNGIRNAQFTVSEVREAAILAAYLEETENPRPRWWHMVEAELRREERAATPPSGPTTGEEGR